MGSINEKNRGRKSRDTAPLRVLASILSTTIVDPEPNWTHRRSQEGPEAKDVRLKTHIYLSETQLIKKNSSDAIIFFNSFKKDFFLSL